MTTQVRTDADREARRRVVREKFDMLDLLQAEAGRLGLSAAAVNLLSAVGRAARTFDDGWWCRLSRAELGRKLVRHSGNVRKQLRRIGALGSVVDGKFGPLPVFPIVEEVPLGAFRLRITHEREEKGNTPLLFVITLGAPAPQPLGAPAPQPLGAPAPQPLGAPAPQGGHVLKGSAGAGARAQQAGINTQVNTQAAAEEAAAAFAARVSQALRTAKGHDDLVAVVEDPGTDWAGLAAWLPTDLEPRLIPSIRLMAKRDLLNRKKRRTPISNPPAFLRDCIEGNWAREKAEAAAEAKFHTSKMFDAHNRIREDERAAASDRYNIGKKVQAEHLAATAAESRQRVKRAKDTAPPMTPAQVEARLAQLRAMVEVST